jgi:hypothetical protein
MENLSKLNERNRSTNKPLEQENATVEMKCEHNSLGQVDFKCFRFRFFPYFNVNKI